MMLGMNALGYEAMAVGNHEYNFWLPVLEKARSEAKFPWLSANTYNKGTNQTDYPPYIIKECAGVRIAVLRLTTPGIPNWENAPNYVGLEFREPLSEAQKWVPILRRKERADVVVIAMHMGLEQDLRTGEINRGQVANENRAVAIAKEVPGVDLIFMGHNESEVPSVVINGVQLIQANYWGRHLARVDLYLENAGSGWRAFARAARTIAVDDRVVPDPEILKLGEPYDRETQAWLSRAIGESGAELTATEARFRDTAILDLIQRVQLEAGKADVSMAAVFNPDARIARGPVTVRDIAGLYVYENTLVVLEVTGQQLKEALEHSAKYFRAYEPGKTPAELVDEKIPAYNFDIAEGVTYTLDISKPFGERIQNLQFQARVALCTPGTTHLISRRRNSEGVVPRLLPQNLATSFRVANNLGGHLHPGFQSKPWADISQRFQRYSIFGRTHEFSTFCATASSGRQTLDIGPVCQPNTLVLCLLNRKFRY